jgi:hypothetical protein
MKRTCLALTVAALCGAHAHAASLTMTQPNGGETMCLGQTYAIKWAAVDIPGNVRLALFKSGAPVEMIAEVPVVPGTYTWNVGQSNAGMAAPGNDYTIRVRATNSQINDFSNGPFTIKAAGECDGGGDNGGGSGGIDPAILAKLRAMRVIEFQLPGPGPNPCLSCPSFDLGSLLDLLGHPNQPVILKLLKNGQPIADLGTIGRGRSIGRTVSPRLSEADARLLKAGGAQFEIGVVNSKGLLEHRISIHNSQMQLK